MAYGRKASNYGSKFGIPAPLPLLLVGSGFSSFDLDTHLKLREITGEETLFELRNIAGYCYELHTSSNCEWRLKLLSQWNKYFNA